MAFLDLATTVVSRTELGTEGIPSGGYDSRMPSIGIDPELNRLALADAAQQYPEFAGRALRVVARLLSRGFAWQLEWEGAAPPGQQAWEFQNAAIRAYKRLARITE